MFRHLLLADMSSKFLLSKWIFWVGSHLAPQVKYLLESALVSTLLMPETERHENHADVAHSPRLSKCSSLKHVLTGPAVSPRKRAKGGSQRSDYALPSHCENEPKIGLSNLSFRARR